MLSQEEVKYIAGLSRIHLSDDEVSHLTKNLGDILHYIEKLKSLNVTDVQPTSHVLPLKNVYREDTIKPSLPQLDVMKLTPNTHKGFFKVPQVIE